MDTSTPTIKVESEPMADDLSSEDGNASAGPSPSSILRFLPLALILAGFILFFVLGGQEYLTFEALKNHRETLSAWRETNLVLMLIGFAVVYALATGFSLPGGVWLTLAGGFLFGTFWAGLAAVAGATVGAIGIFMATKTACSDIVRQKAGPAVRRMEQGFNENALSYLLFLRLVPVFPFWLVNLVPAVLGIPLRTYAIGTFIGIIPGTFIFASVGNGLGSVFDNDTMPDLGIIFEPEILIPILLLAGLSLIPIAIKKFRKS